MFFWKREKVFNYDKFIKKAKKFSPFELERYNEYAQHLKENKKHAQPRKLGLKLIVISDTHGHFAFSEDRLPEFLKNSQDNILKAEYFLPSVVDALIQEKKADVKVVPCQEKWYGVTYKEDKQPVMDAISAMVNAGTYPKKLWS